MKITYDPYADAMYIHTNGKKKGKVHTQQIKSDLMVDFGQKGDLIGIEILEVSRKMPKRSIGRVNVKILSEKPRQLLA